MNTTTWKNRALSVVLTVIMVFSMLPLSAFAAGSDAANGYVAEVTIDGTTTQYDDIDAAFKAAASADSATVKLLADVVEINKENGAGIDLVSGDTTLDLNGKTLKQATKAKYPGSGITIGVGSSSSSGTVGKLTICDSVGGGKIQQINTIPAVMAWGSGTLIIEGGTIEAPESGEWPNTSMNMYLNSAVNIDDNATVIINGGELKGVRGVLEDLNDGGGSLTINGGKFVGTSGNALIVCNGKATLSGGTFSTNSNGHSVWADKGKAAHLLAENYQYIAGDGTESKYSADEKGVVGSTVVKNPNDKSVNYINGKGELSTQADYTEITAETFELPNGWYVVKGTVEVTGLNITNEVHLILCDGATLTVTEYLNVTQNSKLNLYWQSAGSGKLTAKAVSSDSTITAPAGEMKKTTGESGTTFEKCLTHEREYTANEDGTHTATCKLCGKAEAAASHEYKNWASTDEKTHTGACICGAKSTVDHEFVYHLSADKKSHYGVCGVCNYTSAEELHDANGENGSCSVCGADADVAEEKVEVVITALDGTVTKKQYTDLLDAFYDADTTWAEKVEVSLLQSGKTYTLNSAEKFPIKFQYLHDVKVIVNLNGCTLKRNVTDDTYGILSVEKGIVTFKNGTLELDDSASEYNPAQAIKMPGVNFPELTLENMTVKAAKGYAIYAEGGKLSIKSGIYGDILINDNFATAKLSGGSYDSVTCYNGYAKLLETGYIFANKSDGSYVDPSSVGAYGAVDVKVIKCPHKDGDTSLFENDTCKRCGFECHHTGGTASYFQKKVCTTCGAEYGELLTDSTKPTGRITVTERNWFETFLNTITFNLFFKEELTGKITATDDSYTQAGYDASKHAVKIEYIVSDKALTSAELTDWAQYDAAKGIDLTGEQNYVVYAKLTDHAGNETLLSTDGLVIDKTAPSIGDFTDGQEVHICSGQYTVSVNDTYLKKVTVDGEEQTGNSITFRMAETGNTHTVVAEDKAGNTSTVTFTLHGGHDYNSETGVCNHNCGAAAEVKLTDGTGTRVCGTYGDALIEIMRSNTPVTLTLLKDCGDKGGSITQFSKDGLDLIIDLNGHDFGNASDQLYLASPNAGGSVKLNLIGEGSFKPLLWLGRGATLTVGENVTYVSSVKIFYDLSFGDGVTGVSVALKGGKYGEIDLTYTDKNGDTQSVGTLGDLLVPGYVFKTDVAGLSTANGVEVEACAGHQWENGACKFCNLHCGHDVVINGECMECHMTFVAMDDAGNYYSDLNAAFAGVADGGKLTLLANVRGRRFIFDADKTVTLDMAGYKLSVSDTIALAVKSGCLTVTDSEREYINISGKSYSVRMTGGTLKFEKKVNLGGELSVTLGSGVSCKLDGGLKEGSIITGGITVNGDNARVLDLLPEGYAFAEYKADGSIVRADYWSLDGNLIVVAHEHGAFTYDADSNGYYCACGYRHFEHVFDKDGHCTLCDYVCSHDWHFLDKTEDGRWICGYCEAEIAAKVTADGTISCYTAFADAIAKANAATGSAVITLLRTEHLTSILRVTNASGVTLDLNGYVLGGKTLNVGGMDIRGNDIPGKLTVTDSSGGNGTIGLEVKSGGTLVFDPGNNKTSISQLIVWGGDVKLYGGRIQGQDKNKLQLNNGVKMTDLLPEGYAFGLYSGSGSHTSLLYSDASSNKMDAWTSGLDLVPVKCEHEELPENFNGTVCPYCHAALKATVQTAAGKTNGYSAFADALAAANAASGCTLTLLADVDDTLTVKANAAIRLNPNGHTVSGNVIVQKKASLTATGGAFSGKINCVGTLNLTGGTLTGDLSVLGDATLDSCYVGKAVTVNKGGTLTFNGGSLTDVTVNNGGKLEFLSGNASGTVTAKSGGTVTVSNGHIGTLTAENNATLTLSGGNFTKITVSGKKLIDCLTEGCAFKDTNGIVDGRTPILSHVAVVAHPTHEHKWLITTHELVCACGHVKETDTAAPTIRGIADGVTYYQNTLTFTAEDTGSDIKEVKDGDMLLTSDANGKYTIAADNTEHIITATDLAGNTTTVTVTIYKVYKVTLPTGTGYTVTGPDTVNHGEEYVFNVRLDDGYSRVPGRYKVTAGGFELTAMAGDNSYDQYWLPSVTGDLTITVEGIADITAPDAEITIGTNSFKSFLNRITFGLFFKKTQTVTVTADDAGSGVKTVEYLLSDTAFDKPEDITGSWTEINFSDGKAAFDIDPNAKAFIYVRVTDKDGNAAYINSDGVVIYTDSTADTERISFTRLSDEDVSFKVNYNGNWFDQMFISDGNTTEPMIPGLISSDGTITLKNEDLRKLAVGEYTITVTYKPLGENYVEAEGNEAPATTTVKLTVKKATRTLEFSAPDAVYDGAEYDDLRINNIPATTVVQYKAQGAADSTYMTDAPKNVGDYTVRISVDADDNYEAAAFTKNFTISPREVTINGVTADSKTYDGNTEATVNADGATLSVNYDGDNLTIDTSNAKAVFDSKNVGSRAVTFSGFALGGSAAGNYELAAQPVSVTADITAKNLTVENLKVKDKVYDGTDMAEFDGTPTLKGVEDGDEVQLDCGTPAFTATDVGENIAIRFTEFTLTGADSGNYTLIQPTGITGNITAWIADGSEYNVNSRDWINTDFTVAAKTGYLLSLTDAANGTWTDTLTASEETADGKLVFYVKNTETGVISSAVTEHYKIDKTAPTGTVKLDERTPFEEFLNTITFGLFFKDDVTVKLTASDEASGVKSVEYYRSDKALTLTEVKALADSDWTAADSFGITAEDMAQFVIYARITDNAGNITYLSSNGAEFDTTAPEIVGVEDGKTYYVTQRVFVDDTNLASIKLNRSSIAIGSYFDMPGDPDTDATYTVVATDKAGNVTTCTVTMKPISDITDPIKDITEENVKSSDADTVGTVTQQILDIAAESDEDVIGEAQWKKLTEAAANCKKLQTRMANVTAEIARITDAVNSYDIDKVTSADKADIEQLLADIDALLGGNNLTDIERAALEALKQTAQALLDRIAEAKAAAESEEITAVKDITKDNVTLDDKDALEKAKKALEKALDDFGGNYTEAERKQLEDSLKRVRESLDAIGNAEKAAEEIKKLPSVDDVKLSDKNEIERISKIIDDLTDNEKALIGEDTLGKLKALNEKLTELADNAKKPTSPSTGDTSDLALWIALLFISGGVITGVTVAGKKKKQQDR